MAIIKRKVYTNRGYFSFLYNWFYRKYPHICDEDVYQRTYVAPGYCGYDTEDRYCSKCDKHMRSEDTVAWQ